MGKETLDFFAFRHTKQQQRHSGSDWESQGGKSCMEIPALTVKHTHRIESAALKLTSRSFAFKMARVLDCVGGWLFFVHPFARFMDI